MTDARFQPHWTIVRFVIASCCMLTMLDAAAAPLPQGKKLDEERFVSRNWSQIRPNLHFEYGCDTGWHSFSFRSDGFFIYDGNIAGAWWLDHLNNIDVRTNTGERMQLFYDGGNLLTQLERSATAPKSVFGTEYRNYRECPTDKVRMR
jgi:hypothetical protein